ncbi:MAG: EamA family transporter [Candidatus Bathyarchaeia archaeon]
MAVLSMVSTGTSDFIYKRARSKGIAPGSFLPIQAAFFNATSLSLFAHFGRLEMPSRTVLFGIGCGLLLYLSTHLFLRSLGEGQASVNVPIFRLSFIPTAIMAFLVLREAVTPGKVIAILLSAISILSLSKDLLKPRRGSMPFHLISAMLLYSLFGLLYKIAIAGGAAPIGVVTAQGATFITIAFALAISKRSLRIDRPVLSHAPFCGVLLASAFLLLLESLKYGDVSVSFSIVQLSFVFTSALAILIWREEVKASKIFGISAAALSVLLFAHV